MMIIIFWEMIIIIVKLLFLRGEGCAENFLSPRADLDLRRPCFCRTSDVTLRYVVFLDCHVSLSCYLIWNKINLTDQVD
jgi:hypothetical protein